MKYSPIAWILILCLNVSTLNGQTDTAFVEQIKLGLSQKDISLTPLYISTREFHDLISLQTSWPKNQRDQSLMEVNDKYSQWKAEYINEMRFIQEDFHATMVEEEMRIEWKPGFVVEKNSDLWFTFYYTIEGQWIDPKNRKYLVVFEFLAMNFEGQWKLMSPLKELNP